VTPEKVADNVSPRIAYERLNEFLAVLGIAAEAEEAQTERPDEEGR